MNTVLTSYQKYFNFDRRLLFLLLCLISWLVIFINNEFLLSDEIYFNTYGEKVAYDRIERFLSIREQFQWMGYVFVPVTLLVKLSLVSLVINIGTLFFDIKISFARIFKIVLVAETLFIIVNLLRICWLSFIADVSVLEDIQYSYPLSLINFFEPGNLDQWLIYPLTTINLVELAYFLVLAIGLNWATQMNHKKMLSLVASSYGIGLFIWIIFIMFLSINLS